MNKRTAHTVLSRNITAYSTNGEEPVLMFSVDDASRELLADILSLPEMQDEPVPHGDVYIRQQTRNELRQELRKSITAYFMGGDVGVDNG